MSLCVSCKKLVYFAEKVEACGSAWHQSCFRCSNKACNKVLILGQQVEHQMKPYCAHCHSVMFGRQQNTRGSVLIKDHLEVQVVQEVITTTIREKTTIQITMVPKIFNMKF